MKQLVLPDDFAGGPQVTLHGDKARYLSRVRRMGPGDRFRAQDRQGKTYEATIVTVDADTVQCTLVEIADSNRIESLDLPSITLVQGIPRGKKFDQILRQATEAGVAGIIPFLSEFSQVRLNREEGKRKQERWSKIVEEAAQQSGVVPVPTVYLPVGIENIQFESEALVIYCHQENRGGPRIHRLLADEPRSIALFVGPEGGFSPEEVASFDRREYNPWYLGPWVLRSETAPIYALGALRTILAERDQWKARTS